jgi:hypothetical protein
MDICFVAVLSRKEKEDLFSNTEFRLMSNSNGQRLLVLVVGYTAYRECSNRTPPVPDYWEARSARIIVPFSLLR